MTRARTAWERFRHAAATPHAPPPASLLEGVAYGLAQPLLGLRVLLRDRALLRAALQPALLLALVCALWAAVQPAPGRFGIVRQFYLSFAALAPLPSIVFARHYARFAAQAHCGLGFPAAEPRIEPLALVVRKTVAQFLLLAVVPAVVYFPLGLLLQVLGAGSTGGVGGALFAGLTGLWALHWIVVDAFEAGRVLEPGETTAEAEAKAGAAPDPWFARVFRRIEPWSRQRPRLLTRFCLRCARGFREEIALVERHGAVAAGFGLTTAALLVLPGLNVLFRSIVIIGAVHVLGCLTRPIRPTE
jgi:hypothetical protein